MESNFNTELYPSEEGFSYFVSFPNAPPTPIITEDEYRWETDILKIIDETIIDKNIIDENTNKVESISSYSLIHPSLCPFNKNKNENNTSFVKVEYDEEVNVESDERNSTSSADIETNNTKNHKNKDEKKENAHLNDKEQEVEEEEDNFEDEETTDTEDSEIQMLDMMNDMVILMVRISKDVKSIKNKMEKITKPHPTNVPLTLFFGIIFSFWFANFIIRGNALIFDGVSFYII